MPFHLSFRAEVGFVCLAGEFIDLAKTYALMSRTFQGQPKPAYACE
jgi:hypothetical protein